MKRIIMIIAALALLPLVSEAQIVIKKSQEKNMSSVSATVVKKNVIYKERKLYDAKVGFQQFVELSPKMDFWDLEFGHTGINYIGGWRFNNWIYAGVGTGLEFAHNVAKGAKAKVGKTVVKYDNTIYYGDDFGERMEYLVDSDRGSFNRVSIPLYLHCRAYYMRTKWAPYSAVSLGGRLAPKDYGVYFDFSTGVDWRINDDYHAYFSVGFWLSQFKEASGDNYERRSYNEYNGNEYCGSQACPYNHSQGQYHFKFHNIFSQKDVFGGPSFRLGISF